MSDNYQIYAGQRTATLATNSLIRNTYTLLSMTLLFSAIMAVVALQTHPAFFNPWLVIGVYFGLLMLTTALRNSHWGLVSVFALTGWLGYTLGPILNFYIHAFSNGSELVAYALGSTGLIFLALSAYALTTRKDFSYMRGFLMAGILVAFIAAIANLFLHMPVLALAVSTMFIFLMCGLILFETSAIVNGGETNYIMATITLYVALYNLFLSLLQILGVFAGRRD